MAVGVGESHHKWVAVTFPGIPLVSQPCHTAPPQGPTTFTITAQAKTRAPGLARRDGLRPSATLTQKISFLYDASMMHVVSAIRRVLAMLTERLCLGGRTRMLFTGFL